MKKHLFANVLVIILSAALLTACSASPSSETGEKGKDGVTNVRVAYFPNITHAQALVMKANHTLEDALGDACNVSWTSFNAGSSEVEALFAEEIDIGYIGPVPAINGNVKSGGDVVIVSNAADAGAVLIRRSDADIASVADLDGKTVAIPQIGNTQHLCLLNLLKENNLKPVSEGGSVEVVAVDNANMQNMFDQGTIDAALVPEPWGTILTASDGVELLLDYKDIYLDGNYPVAVVVVRKEFMDAHPDIVETFLKIHAETTDAVNEDLDGSADSMIAEIAAVTGNTLDKDVVLQSFSRTNVTTALNEEALQAFAQTSYDQGLISELPDHSLVYPSFADKKAQK